MTSDKNAFTTRDQVLNEQFDRFILDESRVLKSVPFAEFITKNDALGIGLLLPREFDDKEKGVRQEWVPIVITSERGFHPIYNGENRALGVKFDSIPGSMPQRYRLIFARRWCGNMDEAPSGREVYTAIRAAYEENLYFTKQWYSVHAVWDMATYLFGIFPAFPYLELRGVKGAAKTKVMTQSSCFSFNATPIYTSPTEATLFRIVHDQRPTLYLDECENLFRVIKGKVEHDGRVEIINCGYNEGGTVPRLLPTGKGTFQAIAYKAYCPKMLSSINGLYGATESRAIVHVMTRAPDNDPRGEREINVSDPQYQEIREKILLFTLQNWREIKKNYDDLQGTSLKKRELQLWRPLLALARLIGPDVEKDILSVAQHQQQLNRTEDIAEGSWEFRLLERAYHLVRGGARLIYLNDLVEAIPVEERPHNNKQISKILDGLGFRDFERVRETGSNRRAAYVIPSLEDIERVIATLNPIIIQSFPPESSGCRRESAGGNVIEERIYSEEPRRKEENIGGKVSEETEESGGFGGKSEPEEPLAWVRQRSGKATVTEFVFHFGEERLTRLKECGDIIEVRSGFLEILE